jgi:FkbM family methyltransferase
MLVAAAPMARTAVGERVWSRMWAASNRRSRGSVAIRLHGRRVVLNAAHPYPAFLRRWPTYNAPLVELVHQTALSRGAPVDVMDIGAAVGDTALLLLDRCEDDVGHVACVEGDKEFLAYLHANLGDDARVSIHEALLSDDGSEIAGLLRTHAGTASAQGAGLVPTIRLDDLATNGGLRTDVLKIDTDGFDGKILAGSTRVLQRDQPAVIFEWHPRLYEATGNDWHLPFEVLRACGYERLLWFTKFGDFDHVQQDDYPAEIDTRARVCLEDRGPAPDWHYDIVALTSDSRVDDRALAALAHARRTQRRR